MGAAVSTESEVQAALVHVDEALDDCAADLGCSRDELPDDAYADMVRAVAWDYPEAVQHEMARRTGVRVGDYDPMADV
jgi:hypothetical protein